jgi:hypothetical protein
VSSEGKFPDPKKIEAIVNMPTPRTIKDIQVFNGLAQFNRCFIRDYAKIMAPITALTRKDESIIWTTECATAFTDIKKEGGYRASGGWESESKAENGERRADNCQTFCQK